MSRETFTSFYSQDLCNQVDVLHKVDMWWLIEDHGGHIYLALDSLSFLFLLLMGEGGGASEPYLHFKHSLPFSLVF